MVRGTIIDRLALHAGSQGPRIAFRFLHHDRPEQPAAELSYLTLAARARTIAQMLRRADKQQRTVLLLYPWGEEFVSAFLGSLHAGVIAVPAYPPDPGRLNRTLPRLQAIARDSRADLILTVREVRDLLPQISAAAPELAELAWIATDELATDHAAAAAPPGDAEQIAFLQYTSGSTGDPKGVMISHANLRHNAALMNAAWPGGADHRFVCWLPLYHDMGLIANVLQTVELGARCTLLPPLQFLARPRRWLEVLTEEGGTISMAPNFAYDLCVRKVPREQLDGLSLGRWAIAVNAAEPSRPQTMERFAERFGPVGFRTSAFEAAFGLAESTVFATGRGAGRGMRSVSVLVRELGNGRVVQHDAAGKDTLRFASNGAAWLDQEARLVDPETLLPTPPGRVGEVWLRGASVGRGYWQRPEATEDTFGARLADTGEGPFLRTGDLAFLEDGEIFITGRLKDVIIISGVNFYPHDIEHTVQEAHAGIRPGCVVAFGVDDGATERLAIVAEVYKKGGDLPGADIAQAVRRGIFEKHELSLDLLVLIAPNTMFKTTSGKVQRRRTRAALLAGALQTLYRWESPRMTAAARAGEADAAALAGQAGEAGQTGEAGEEADQAARSRTAAPGARELSAFIADWLDRNLEVDRGALGPATSFADLGLDSAAGVQLTAALADWAGQDIAPTIIWKFSTIEALAEHLAGSAAPRPHATPRPRAAAGREPEPPRETIAVVGFGCRFPAGAHSPEAYWDALCRGQDGIVEIPATRWDWSRYYDPDPAAPGRMYVNEGGFLRCPVDTFDARFFGIAPREAVSLDPQQRLLLEVTWEALESAGLRPSALSGARAGVFVGISGWDYGQRAMSAAGLEQIDAYTLTGSHPSIAAGRIAYVFGFQGPALAIDTACSSSLVAVHQACQSLLSDGCDLAVAGGVNILLAPEPMVALSKLRALSPDARCKTFDRAANGYARAEGCGVLILKRLRDARADRDPILAVIHGSAVNQDGRSNGLTAPSGSAQEQVIRQALAAARLSPRQIGYVECHGTGTALGDSIEVAAIVDALLAEPRDALLTEPRDAARDAARDEPRVGPLLLGAVKSNLGHMEAAAGVAGLIKAILAVDRGELPPNLHFNQPNPKIDWSKPLAVPTRVQPWSPDGPRFAGVSSFGFGGTNAHVIIGQGPRAAEPATGPAAEPAAGPATGQEAVPMLLLSARSEAALRESAARWAERLEAAEPAAPPASPVTSPPASPPAPAVSGDLADLAFTAATGRERFAHALVVRGRQPAELRERLADFAAGGAPAGCSTGTLRDGETKLAFLFTGQGSQFPGMGRALYQRQPVFRETIDRCASLLARHRDLDLRHVLFATDTPRDRHLAALMDRTSWTQPCLFALELALARLWRSWGFVPDAVLGHSLGEITAACFAEVMSLEDAVLLVHERARRMDALPPGAMAALPVAEERARALIGGEDSVSVACVNSPAQTIVSGPEDAVLRVLGRAEAGGIRGRRLAVSHALHASPVESMLAPFGAAIANSSLAAPSIPLVSGVSGQLAGAEVATPGYWVRQIREAVRFADGMMCLHRMGVRAFIECGPRPALLGLGRRCVPEDGQLWLPSLTPAQAGDEALLDSLGRLGANGWPLPVEQLFGSSARRVSAPTYPFQRERYWLDRQELPGAPRVEAEQRGAPASPGAKDVEAAADALDDRGHDARGHDARDHVVAAVAAALGTPREQLSDQTDLYALGLDSLMLVDLIADLERRLGVSITAQAVAASVTTASGSTRAVLSLGALLAQVRGARAEGVALAPLREASALSWRRDRRGEGPFAGRFDQTAAPGAAAAAAALESGCVEIAPGLEIEYLSAGRGEPVLLLPPLNGSIHHWLPLARALAPRYRVIAMNYPGCGRSSARLHEARLERLAAIAVLLLDGLRVEQPAHVIGWSLGGFVAQRLAVAHPDRVRSLSLVSSSACLGEPPTAGAMARARALLAQLTEDLAACLARVEDPARRAALAALLEQGRGSRELDVLMHYAAEAERFDARAALADIRCPALIVSGALDLSLPGQHAELLRQGIAGAAHARLDTAGHFIPVFETGTLVELFETLAARARDGRPASSSGPAQQERTTGE